MVEEVTRALQCVQGWGLDGGGGGGGGGRRDGGRRGGGKRGGGRKGDDRGRRRWWWWWWRRRSRGTSGAVDLGLDCGLGGRITCLLGSRGGAAMGLARMLAEEVPGRD